ELLPTARGKEAGRGSQPAPGIPNNGTSTDTAEFSTRSSIHTTSSSADRCHNTRLFRHPPRRTRSSALHAIPAGSSDSACATASIPEPHFDHARAGAARPAAVHAGRCAVGAGRPLARCGREAGGAALPAWVRRGCCCCWDAWRRSCRLPAPPSSARPWTATSPSRCRPAGRSASTSLCARRPRWSSSTRVETEEGDYMFCFDNTFSTISEKVIFFELILDNMGEEGQDQEDWKKYVTGTDLLDMKLEDILESINSVKARLSKSVQIQTLLRAFEARDRNIQESNFDRVNFWSMVNLGVMVVVSAVQVYMLKSLFEDKRKSRT
uniref:Transmembrane p24 trafficking protein 5 n=1 Tax=Gallus gallus TaxID=9031 RepID=A0A8V0ZM00_CHICK